MEEYTINDSINRGTWHYGDKYIEGRKVGILINFRSKVVASPNHDKAIEIIKQALQHLKRMNCEYAVTVGPTRNRALIYCVLMAGDCRVFVNNEEIGRREIDRLIEQCSKKSESPICKTDNPAPPTQMSFPLNGKALPPFRYMELDRNGNVLKIIVEKPKHSNYKITRHFSVGDEKGMFIRVDGSAIHSIRKASMRAERVAELESRLDAERSG